jgi:hypothetical protein
LPVYRIGVFGGCTAAIIDAIEGRSPDDENRRLFVTPRHSQENGDPV